MTDSRPAERCLCDTFQGTNIHCPLHGTEPYESHRTSNEEITAEGCTCLRSGHSHSYACRERLIERLTREKSGYRDALGRIHSQRDRMEAERDAAERKALTAENERDRLRAALSHVKGRAQIRDSATVLDIIRLVDEALSGEPGSAVETSERTGCAVHGECSQCRAMRVLGDPRESVSIQATGGLFVRNPAPHAAAPTAPTGSIGYYCTIHGAIAIGSDCPQCSALKATGKCPHDRPLGTPCPRCDL